MGWNQAGNDMDITWYGNPVFDDADGSLRIAGTGQYGIVDRGAQGFNFAGEFTIEFLEQIKARLSNSGQNHFSVGVIGKGII